MILDFYQLYLMKIPAVVVKNKHTFLVYAEKIKNFPLTPFTNSNPSIIISA